MDACRLLIEVYRRLGQHQNVLDTLTQLVAMGAASAGEIEQHERLTD